MPYGFNSVCLTILNKLIKAMLFTYSIFDVYNVQSN